MVFGVSKAVSDAAALVSKAKETLKRFYGLRLCVEKFRGQGNIRQSPHDVVGAYCDGMEAVYGADQTFARIPHFHG